jgi:hypothetical protein
MRQHAKYLILILIATSHLSFAKEQIPSLFRTASKIPADKALDDATVKRQRLIYVNTSLLNTEKQALQHKELMLNLFKDTTFVAKLDRVETFSENGVGWVGHLRSVEDSQVILIIRNGKLTGNILLPDILYKVSNSGNNGLHTIKEINLSKMPPKNSSVPIELGLTH